MTTPSYATEATGRQTASTPGLAQDLTEQTGSQTRLVRALRSAAGRPRALQAGLDTAAVAFIVMAFATTAVSAEFLFHCVFVLLVLHAFLFGLRGTLLRIALVSVPLIVRADAPAFGLGLPDLELTEWPLMFVIAVLVAWMADQRSATSQRYAGLFRVASERLLTVEEDERRRIAGELHDGVGQVLTALTLTLDAAASAPASVIRRRVATARELAESALADTRDLSHRMQPGRLEERGLVTALRDLAAQSGFAVHLEAGQNASDRRLLGPTATVEVYRIVQEALANAARHSGAAGADLHLRRRGGDLLVDVVDAGVGFDPGGAPGPGIGLAGMVERARLIGARLVVESRPGAGTRVSLRVPIASGR